MVFYQQNVPAFLHNEKSLLALYSLLLSYYFLHMPEEIFQASQNCALVIVTHINEVGA
jgi:hypothetical protein